MPHISEDIPEGKKLRELLSVLGGLFLGLRVEIVGLQRTPYSLLTGNASFKAYTKQ